MTKTSIKSGTEGLSSYASRSTTELPLITDDFNFSVPPIRSNIHLLQKISKLKEGQELYLDPNSFSELTSNQNNSLVIQHIIDNKGYSFYLLSIKDNLSDLVVIYIDGSQITLNTVAKLGPGTIIANINHQLQLPDFYDQMDPFLLLRAPLIDLNAEVLVSGNPFKAYKGESLYGEYCAISCIGEGSRNSNEDGFLKLDSSLGKSNFFVFDGIGGQMAGEVACDIIARYLAYNLRLNFTVEESLANSAKALENEHRDLSESVLTNVEETSNMGVCLAGCEVSRKEVRLYNLGDCQGLFLKCSLDGDYKIAYRTPIRTVPSDLLRAGEITSEEFYARKDHNVITTSILLNNGSAITPSVDSCSPLEINNEDLVVLASDGLFDNICEEEIVKLCNKLRSPEKILRALFATTRKVITQFEGTDDNLTILVYKHDLPAK